MHNSLHSIHKELIHIAVDLFAIQTREGRIALKALSEEDLDGLLEDIAKLEHDQWVDWSKAVGDEVKEDRKKRWEGFWVPYSKLTDKDKDSDRDYAKKIIDLLKKRTKEIKSAAYVPEIVVDVAVHPDLMMQYPNPTWESIRRKLRPRVDIPFSGRGPNPHIILGDPARSRSFAVREGEGIADDFQKAHWPGGMAKLVAILKWVDSMEDTAPEYQAVVNAYSSPS